MKSARVLSVAILMSVTGAAFADGPLHYPGDMTFVPGDRAKVIAADDAAVAHANGVLTFQIGPDDVMAALSVEFDDRLTAPEMRLACVASKLRSSSRIQKSQRYSSGQKPMKAGAVVT